MFECRLGRAQRTANEYICMKRDEICLTILLSSSSAVTITRYPQLGLSITHIMTYHERTLKFVLIFCLAMYRNTSHSSHHQIIVPNITTLCLLIASSHNSMYLLLPLLFRRHDLEIADHLLAFCLRGGRDSGTPLRDLAPTSCTLGSIRTA